MSVRESELDSSEKLTEEFGILAFDKAFTWCYCVLGIKHRTKHKRYHIVTTTLIAFCKTGLFEQLCFSLIFKKRIQAWHKSFCRYRRFYITWRITTQLFLAILSSQPLPTACSFSCSKNGTKQGCHTNVVPIIPDENLDLKNLGKEAHITLSISNTETYNCGLQIDIRSRKVGIESSRFRSSKCRAGI